MSRKASKPIQFSNAVKIDRTGDLMTIKGPKGELTVEMKEGIEVKIENNQIYVDRKDESQKPFQGLIWSLINNAVIGVTQGFSRTLQVVGKGWRSGINGDLINLQVGYSHPMDYKLPKGVTATQKNPGEFTLHSYDKQLLGQVCAKIKAIRPVEPYKLKGIRIEGQFLRQKVRKAAGV
ncbi:MAG TPA: 50S ribosomal protein L6 [Candidatus Deferrimicrobium sp.]|nr:50S ribosomal protein L6 [Candidatus Deferrimicrobium sp.]